MKLLISDTHNSVFLPLSSLLTADCFPTIVQTFQVWSGLLPVKLLTFYVKCLQIMHIMFRLYKQNWIEFIIQQE